MLNCALWAEAKRGEGHLDIGRDSRSTIEALKAYTTTSMLVYDCYQTLNRLADSRPLTIFWLPGHTGIKGNKIADRLARQARREVLNGPEPATGICDIVINAEIDRWVAKKHAEAWNNAPGCRTAKTFTRIQRWRVTKTVVGIITGHGTLRKHRHTMEVERDSTCRFCGKEDETSLHVIFGCPALVESRRLYLGDPA